MSKLNQYMQKWAGEMKMGRLSVTCTCEAFLRTLLVLSCTIYWNVIMSSAQDSKGFFSIDFGSGNSAPYRDSKTGLMWETDGKYGISGMSGVVPHAVDPSLENHEALQRFRYFPERKSRYCLSLRNKAGVYFLLRTMFLHGGSLELPLPIKFRVFVNATSWFIVEYENSSSPSVGIPKVMEGIFYATGITNLCLVPIVGVPFISSLELRQLDIKQAMYSFSGHQDLFLNTLIRLNLGVPADSSILRYPDDQFDRFWAPPHAIVLGNPPRDIDVFSGSSFFPNATSPQINNVPPEVMKSAWVGYNLSELDASFALTTNLSYMHDGPINYAYAVLYIWTANATDRDYTSKLQGMNFALNGFDEQPFNFSSTEFTMEGYPSLYLGTYDLNLELKNLPGYTPPGPPLLNAIEVYEEIIFNVSFTIPADETAIVKLLQMLNVTDWEGDPCAPVPLDWITCDHVLSWNTLLSIHSISFSNLTIGPNMANLTGFENSTSTYLLNTLESFSLTDSKIAHDVMQNLNNYFTCPNLQILNLSNNSIKVLPLKGDPFLGQFWPLKVLNLSHNDLVAAPSFVHWKYATHMEILDLSYNNIAEFPEDWQNHTTNVLDSLTVLNLSHNSIQIATSSFEESLAGNSNSVSLQEMYMSDNNISGPFSNVKYFSDIPDLRVLNLDRNFIQGTLNLTRWHRDLQHTVINCDGQNNVFCGFSRIDKLYSFVNNEIQHVTPSSKVLESTIDSILQLFPNFTQRGILLGGNPYCIGVESTVDKYLCRYTVNDKFEGFQKKGTKLAWKVLAGLGTSVGFIICCSLLLVIWKLGKQVTALKEIQQALAEQSVRPPFYSFKDLKIATRDFKEKNKLGRGAFGAVYKGVLKDGTTVAVKRLFNNHKVQVLNEFLNEVVLITGIKHRNLVQLKGCCIEEGQRILVYEYCENGNLADGLWGQRNFGVLIWEQRFQICVGIARGLCYLHEQIQPRIIHRDIKPANILLDEKFNCKIADFGLARPFLDEQSQASFTNIAGTPAYFAPEYATQGQLTVKADVYSFGLLVLEIFSGRKCVDCTQPSERMNLRNWALSLHKDGMLLELLQPEFKKHCPDQEVVRLINIGLICVQMDPDNRPTMSQVLTMLTGNMDVTSFVNASRFYLLDFETLVPPNKEITGHTTVNVSDLNYTSAT